MAGEMGLAPDRDAASLLGPGVRPCFPHRWAQHTREPLSGVCIYRLFTIGRLPHVRYSMGRGASGIEPGVIPDGRLYDHQ
jgi:hypothetical protein